MRITKVLIIAALCLLCAAVYAQGRDIMAGPRVLFSIKSDSTVYNADERAAIIQENVDKVLLSPEVPEFRMVQTADKSIEVFAGDIKIGDCLKEDAALSGVPVTEEAARWITGIKAAYGTYVNRNQKFVLTSDIHNCHQSWYGLPNDGRMRKWVQAITREQNRGKIDGLFILGDVSLDYWMNGGSYNKGTSNTKNFINKYLKSIPNAIKWYIVPGNHEQYAPEVWKEITGLDRRYAVNMGNTLFIMLDAFAEDLGAKYDHDGKYVPHDVEYIRSMLAKYPAKNVFLCSHWFDVKKETAEFKALVAGEPRIVCMFNGHDHQSKIDRLGEEWGNKCIIHTGEFSYYGVSGADDIYWGYRVLNISVSGDISTDYVVPAHNIMPDKSVKLVPEKRYDLWECKH